MLNTATDDRMLERRTRDQLIQLGLPLVRRAAFRMARRLPPSVDVGDLIGAGAEGLMKAVESYDPERYPRFEPYAEMRVRGAILDELRSWDAMTRHGRRRMLEVSKAVKRLTLQLERMPNEEEIAKELGMELEDYQRLSMELARGPALGRLGVIDPDHIDSGFDDPASIYSAAELRERLANAIRKLPERMQTVLGLYYQEDCTQSEIGEIIGVSESRVCQILGDAAARLRALLQREEDGSKFRRRV